MPPDGSSVLRDFDDMTADNQSTVDSALWKFAREQRFIGKGPLCVALVVTRRAMADGLPLDPADLRTAGRGQVKGLGKSAVQKILAEYGVTQVLAEEGGRTSRGSLGKMEAYVKFLNDLSREGDVDLQKIEQWWVERVREFLAGKPLRLRLDPSKSARTVISDLLQQAEQRQRSLPGATVLGTVLQHLVGAKLDLIERRPVHHHPASSADEPSGREADFEIDDVRVHVTSAPGEALIRKCRENLAHGLRPVIITTRPEAARQLCEVSSIEDRVDIFDAEQFLAGNLYELGGFGRKNRQATLRDLVNRYNAIVSEVETDRSLQIEV